MLLKLLSNRITKRPVPVVKGTLLCYNVATQSRLSLQRNLQNGDSVIKTTNRLLVKLGIVLLLSYVASVAAAQRAVSQEAKRTLDATGNKGGLVIHIGCGDGKLATALRSSHSFLVQGLDADAADVAKARRHIQSLGVYGAVSGGQASGSELPYVENLVSLRVAEDLGDVSVQEVMRVLARGGVEYVKDNEV